MIDAAPAFGAEEGLGRGRNSASCTSAHGELSALDAKYELLRELGAGGMGIVYEARHLHLNRRFAIKLLKPHLNTNGAAVTRFAREARLAASLTSPHLAAPLDIGTWGGVPCILMELLEGESLQARMAHSGRFSCAAAARLIAEACTGIRAAHDCGIVHRDLKPANLFVCRESESVKVLDFGMAKLLDAEDSDQLTASGAFVGTIAYMSPEQVSGAPVGPATDVYALGTILYELVAGRRPFLGERPHHLIRQIAYERPPNLRSVADHVPESLCSIVHSMLARCPEQRPNAATVERLLAPIARLAPPEESALSWRARLADAATVSGARAAFSAVIPMRPARGRVSELLAVIPGWPKALLAGALVGGVGTPPTLGLASFVREVTAQGQAGAERHDLVPAPPLIPEATAQLGAVPLSSPVADPPSSWASTSSNAPNAEAASSRRRQSQCAIPAKSLGPAGAPGRQAATSKTGSRQNEPPASSPERALPRLELGSQHNPKLRIPRYRTH